MVPFVSWWSISFSAFSAPLRLTTLIFRLPSITKVQRKVLKGGVDFFYCHKLFAYDNIYFVAESVVYLA